MRCAQIRHRALFRGSAYWGVWGGRSPPQGHSPNDMVICVLSGLADSFLSNALPDIPECFIGARPRTQCLDVADGIQYVLEKGLDNFGQAAAAQCDIEKYYDSLPVLEIVRWLVDRGLRPGIAACLLRHQMYPRLLFQFDGAEFRVSGRTVGGLTGSRVAGLLGRIPVESTAAERTPHWRKWGFRFDGQTLCFASWVDNLYSVSDSLDGAIAILEDFERHLQQNWHMRIKSTSRSCITSFGNAELSPDLSKWPMTDEFKVLGHTLQNNGSIRACWTLTKRGMWRAFWGNAGARDAKKLPETSKHSLLHRAVAPQFLFRCSRWPPQTQVGEELDRVQRTMVATIIDIARVPGESAQDFVRRRGRAAAAKCRQHGLWSDQWFTRAVRWDEHLARDRNASTWAARIRHFRDRNWFLQRRLSFLRAGAQTNQSVLAGRTATRSGQGKVNVRWHDGIFFAQHQGQ